VTAQSSAWTKFTTQISPTDWAGLAVEIGFLATTDDLYTTSFLVDSASLTVAACPAGTGAN